MEESSTSSQDTTSTKRPIQVGDLYRFLLVSDPQASPDGSKVAYVQTRLRKKKNDYGSNIWLTSTDGSGDPVKFTGSDARDMSPRWSPNGTQLAFLSTRSGGKPQIWLINTSGGEAQRLTKASHGIGEFEWSPDGKWIAYTSQLDSERDKELRAEAEANKDNDTSADSDGDSDSEQQHDSTSEEGLGAGFLPAGEWEEDEDISAPKEKADHVRIVDRVHYIADGAGFLERWSHIFLIPATGGKAQQLTEGPRNVQSPRWSPDGKQLAFLTNMEEDADYRNIQDIFVIDIADDGKASEPQRITHHDLSIRSMDWLPSGQGFALYAHTRLDEAAFGTNAHVYTLTLEGKARDLTASLDRNVALDTGSDLRSGTGQMRPYFSKDGSEIFFLATDRGTAAIYSVSIEGGEVNKVVDGDRITLNFSIRGDKIVFAATTPTNPNDIYSADLDGSNERALTNVNSSILTTLDVGQPHTFWVDRGDDVKVQGWLIHPPGYDKSKQYPLVLVIHGGPHTAFGEAYFHEFQVLAAKGYIVLYTNPRGSQGYGQAFSDAIINDWGGIDYEDIMACVDHAISLGAVDESRLGVSGGSYGGYMSAWIIGHTDRFKAAVASRLVSNLYSAWGSGDFTWMLWSWEFQGTPQERAELYIERSPVHHAANINTPLLLTHAEDDHRCNLEQAQQMYMALRTRKKEVKMVLFPAGGHEISRSGKPTLRVDRLNHILEWFEQHFEK